MGATTVVWYKPMHPPEVRVDGYEFTSRNSNFDCIVPFSSRMSECFGLQGFWNVAFLLWELYMDPSLCLWIKDINLEYD